MQCPVPGCKESFATLARLSSHLRSFIRRNRCGAFIGTIDFDCTCGRQLHSIEMIHCHASLHSKSTLLGAMSNEEEITILYPERPDDAFEDESNDEIAQQLLKSTDVDLHDDSDNEIDVDNELIDETHLLLDGANEYDGSDYEGDYMFEQLHFDGDDKSDEESIDSDKGNDGLSFRMSPTTVCFRAGDGVSDLSQSMKNALLLYRYCLENNVTVRGYKQLRSLPMFEAYQDLPSNLKHLRRKVERFVEDTFRWPVHRITNFISDENCYVTAYMSPSDCLAIWLAVPVILGAVRDFRMKFLPLNLVDATAYDELVAKRNSVDGYVYESIADGSVYLDAWQSAIPLFEDEYLRAVDEEIEVITLTFGLYEDVFTKNLNSLISQTIFCITLMEATTGEAQLTGLASLVYMIANAVGAKSLGGDDFRTRFIDELRKYERGVKMNVNGRECLIICLTIALMGDIPALKTMIGMSPSISATCYVRMPCMLCEVIVEELANLESGAERSVHTVHEFAAANDNRTGFPSTAWLRETMKGKGFLRIPEIVRLHNQPSRGSITLDTMHILLKGVLVRHFCRLVKVLKGGISVVRRRNIWSRISTEFAKYCRDNKISAFCNFHSKKEFKLRMTAGSMREFTKVSSSILRKLLINVEDESPAGRNRIEFFNYWCIHVKIAGILERHSISSSTLRDLAILVDQLLSHWKEYYPASFATIKVHFYRHFVEQLRGLGSLRVVANNSREHLIQKLKPYYRNCNNSGGKEVAVFRRYKMGLFFNVYDLIYRPDSLRQLREYLPSGFSNFNFYLYDKVVLDNNDYFRSFEREDSYVELEGFTYNKGKSTKFKVNYCVLQPGHVVCVSTRHMSVTDVGVLVTILHLQEEAFIAYVKPVATVNEDHPLLYFRVQKVTESLKENILYIAPVNSFISRLYVYSVDTCYKEVIRS